MVTSRNWRRTLGVASVLIIHSRFNSHLIMHRCWLGTLSCRPCYQCSPSILFLELCFKGKCVSFLSFKFRCNRILPVIFVVVLVCDSLARLICENSNSVTVRESCVYLRTRFPSSSQGQDISDWPLVLCVFLSRFRFNHFTMLWNDTHDISTRGMSRAFTTFIWKREYAKEWKGLLNTMT